MADGERLTKIETLLEGIASDVGETKRCLFGNGHPGVLRDVDRLKQAEKQRVWYLRLFLIQAVALTAWILKSIIA